MKVFMTGSSGVVGSILSERLEAAVTGYDLPENDMLDYDNLKKKLSGHDAIVHLAWNAEIENFTSGSLDTNNMAMAYNCLQAAVETNTKRVILISSVHADKFDGRHPDGGLLRPYELPLPDSPYGASKCFVELLGRHYAEKYGLEVICIRLGRVRAESKPPVSPESERQVWLSNDDLTSLITACLEAPEVPYNFTILYGVSDNEGRLHDLSNPFGWKPKDGASLKAEIKYTPLITKPVPDIYPAQIDKFSFESIHAERVSAFDPEEAFGLLKAKEGSRVIGADFGGDKGLTQLYVIKDGKLQPDPGYKDYVQSTHGDGFLESLEKTARYANDHNIPVGISWGAPLDGTKVLYHPKMDHFLEAMKEKYDDDFANVIPTLKACMNDGPSGLISGIIEVGRARKVDSVLFTINGGGLGMAALARKNIYATEPGHVEAVPELNTYDQHVECGVYGARYICLEKLGANKSGIEAQWEARHGYMRARDIEDRFKEGNLFAGEIYDHSALVVAHMIIGEAKALDIDLTSATMAIVAHGGAFKFPDYGARIQQIIEKYTGVNPYMIMTHTYGSKDTNACLDGAALAAAISK